MIELQKLLKLMPLKMSRTCLGQTGARCEFFEE